MHPNSRKKRKVDGSPFIIEELNRIPRISSPIFETEESTSKSEENEDISEEDRVRARWKAVFDDIPPA